MLKCLCVSVMHTGEVCSYPFPLALVVLHGGDVGQVTLQRLDALLLLPVLLRLLLAFLLQAVDVLVSVTDL